ncbi:MAG TPA: hypothetical protein PLI31_02900 [Methanoregulaceae archaeon]|nr:hypothetical protein [Methanoregulaceae archaeon]
MGPRSDTSAGAVTLLAFVLAIAGAAGISAWVITGDQGIEERFATALGVEEEDAHEHPSAVPFEGDPWLYLGGLFVLGGAVIVLYRRYPP